MYFTGNTYNFISMKKNVHYILLLTCLLGFKQMQAQQSESSKDSVIQLFGVVMTADSLRGVPSASVVVVGKGRGTITNGDGKKLLKDTISLWLHN